MAIVAPKAKLTENIVDREDKKLREDLPTPNDKPIREGDNKEETPKAPVVEDKSKVRK